MKQLSIALAAAMALHPAVARADGGPFGLGIIVGNPTGITGAYKLGGNTAIDAAVGLGGFDFDGLYVHVDFLFLLPDLVTSGPVRLSPYLGPGGFLNVGRGNNSGSGGSGSGGGSKGAGLGVRVPFGLSLDFSSFPLQLFIELAPQLEVVPDPDFGLGGALGFRYYF
jgi:hypothetical protein